VACLTIFAAWLGAALPRSTGAQGALLDGRRVAIVFGVPLLVVALRLLARGEVDPWFTRLAVAMGTVAGALAGGRLVAHHPLLVFVPAIVSFAYLAVRRWPSRALIAAFFLASAYGSIEAFTGVSAGQLTDLVLAGLWLTFLVPLVVGKRTRELRLTPGIVLLLAYVAMTIGALMVSTDVNFAARAFRLSTWHLMAVIPVAYLGWKPVTLDRVVRVFGVIALLVGAYATLRWAIGPSGREKALLQNANGVMYNQTGIGEDKVQGSFPNGQELGLWASIMLPFCLAGFITWRGPWKIVAAGAIPLCGIGLLGSGQRSGFVAGLAGILVVLVVNALARGLRGPRLGIAATALVALVIGGAVVFPAVVDSPAKVQRYTNILTPQRDGPFQERLFKWRNAFADLRGHPFGRGIGQGGAAAAQQRFSGNGSDKVDNSYVKIAYEQGPVVMLFFAVTLLVLLFELVRHAIWTRAPGSTAHAMAAAGVLTALILEFAGNLHIESLACLAGLLIVATGLVQVLAPPEPA
jgi:hypothetical protein